MLFTLHQSGREYASPIQILPTHRVLTDFEIGRTNRPRLPMVFVFDENNTHVPKEWQFYIRATNYGMSLNAVSNLIESKAAFTNGTGVGATAYRRNWILMEDMKSADPELDKTRICGDATFQMIGNVVTSMDGTKLPMLRPGYSQPRTVAEAHWDMYVFTPFTHPALFFPAVTTGTDFKAHPYPGSSTYPWYKNGTTPVAFMPLVSDQPIIYPPEKWTDNTPQVVEL